MATSGRRVAKAKRLHKQGMTYVQIHQKMNKPRPAKRGR